MGLTAALAVGRTGLVASQAAIQVAGNNLANASTPGYTRQRILLTPNGDQLTGAFALGRGVGIRGVERQVDEALAARLRAGVSSESSASEQTGLLEQLESILGELSEFDLSSNLSTFFNAWSDAANLTKANGVLVQSGRSLASFIQGIRDDIGRLRSQIEVQINERVARADTLLTQVAELNAQISAAELPGQEANALRDQRDVLLSELSGLVDIDTIEDSRGIVDVFVDSSPVVLAGESLGLSVERRSDGVTITTLVTARTDGSVLSVQGGSIGGLLASRDGTIDVTLDRLDELARSLIFEVNKVTATASGPDGHGRLESGFAVPGVDRAEPLNSPGNATFAGLPFEIVNGAFLVNVVNRATGVRTQTSVEVDLDVINSGLGGGTGDDQTLAGLVGQIDAISGISAGFDAAGRVFVQAESGFGFSFQEDTSGLLGALGFNGFFDGVGSGDIAVREALVEAPGTLTLGRFEGQRFIENGAALAVAGLQDEAQAQLNGASLRGFWSDAVQSVANEAGTASVRLESARIVRESLEAQRDALSGVSIDEESVDLLTFQRQFQGSARVISTVDELLDTLISII